jgi:hypothetical protein
VTAELSAVDTGAAGEPVAGCSGQREAMTDRCASAAVVAIDASAAIAGASPSLRFGCSIAAGAGSSA